MIQCFLKVFQAFLKIFFPPRQKYPQARRERYFLTTNFQKVIYRFVLTINISRNVYVNLKIKKKRKGKRKKTKMYSISKIIRRYFKETPDNPFTIRGNVEQLLTHANVSSRILLHSLSGSYTYKTYPPSILQQVPSKQVVKQLHTDASLLTFTTNQNQLLPLRTIHPFSLSFSC